MSVNRITGMYSGFDTEKLVTDLMKTEQTRVDKVIADKQRLQWKQDQYREITTLMTGFKSDYFDVLKSDTNLTSKTMFSEFSTSVQSNGVDVDALTVEGTSEISSLTHTVGSITQLATKDEYSSSGLAFTAILSDTFDFASMPANFKINLTIDGTTKTLSFDKVNMNSPDIDGFIDSIQDQIEIEFGSDFRDVVSKDVDKISFTKPGSLITVLGYSGSEDSLTFLGIDSGESSNSYSSKTMGELLGVLESDLANMTINGKSFVDLGITVDSTIKELTNTINNSSLDAEIFYNKLSDKFEIKSTKYGTANDLDLSTEFKSKFKLDSGVHTVAQNAILEIDGESVVKSTNTFTLSGVKYTLNKAYSADPIDIIVNRDTTKIFDKLKSFITDYNNIIEIINDKLDEKTYRSYNPLTDDEKKELSDDNIKLWEEKAKSGSLKNDNTLKSMLSGMRSALYESVEGTDISLYEIGITTSPDYKENGKLIIDETKLKESLANEYDSIVSLFTSKSDKEYMDNDNKVQRNRENGLGNRLLDIINDAVRLTRNSNNQKGSLIEKAGIVGDTSTTSNLIAKDMAKYDVRIANLLDYLADQESRYYNKFTAMEKALSEMQSQSSALMSQFGQ